MVVMCSYPICYASHNVSVCTGGELRVVLRKYGGSGKTRNDGNGNGETEMRKWKWETEMRKWRNGNGEAETSYTN